MGKRTTINLSFFLLIFFPLGQCKRREANDAVRKEVKQQQELIQKLRQENESLKHDLGMSKEDLSVGATEKAATLVSQLQEEANMYAKKLNAEEDKEKRLESSKEAAEKQVQENRKKMGGVDAQQESLQQGQRKISILEHRVDRETRRLNEAVARNKELRKEINNVRLERHIFAEAYEKRERDLEQTQEAMRVVAEQSNGASETMDQFENELAAVQAQADKEHVDYEHEWRELGKQLESDLLREKRTRREAHAYLGSKEQVLNERESKLKKKRIGRHSLSSASKNPFPQSNTGQLKSSFQFALSETGYESVDALVNALLSKEDENDAIFRHAGDLNREADGLEEEISSLKAEIDQANSSRNDGDNRQRAIESLEQKVSHSKSLGEHYESLASSAFSTVEEIKLNVLSLCSDLSCSPPNTSAYFLTDGSLTEEGAVTCLAQIEQRANEMLRAASQSQAESEEKSEPPALPAASSPPATAASTAQLGIEPPSTAAAQEDEEDEESAEMPLTREDLLSAGKDASTSRSP